MKIKISILFVAFSFLISFENYAQQLSVWATELAITNEELNLITGSWTGKLTYLDYSSSELYSMLANVVVTQSKNKKQLTLNITYPKEPKANSKDKIKISKNGLQLNKKPIKYKQELPNGELQIITEYEDMDNNKKAIIRNTYIVGEKRFIIKKEVQFDGSEKWLKRNEYSFKR